MNRLGVLIFVMLGLAALGAVAYLASRSGGGASGNMATMGNANDRLLGLPPAEQNAMLISYIGNAGGRCFAVSRSFYQGLTENGRGIWSVRCHRGVDWSLRIAADGAAGVGACTLADVSIACWRPLRDEARSVQTP